MPLNLIILIVVAAVASCVVAVITAGILGRNGPTPYYAKHRFGHLDGLRGYLSIGVLVHHFTLWIYISRFEGHWDRGPVFFFNQLGIVAVSLFFMITGFIFYPRTLIGLRSTPWMSIFIGRLFRIVPLVAVSVSLVALIIWGRAGGSIGAEFIISLIKWISTYDDPDLFGYPNSKLVNAGVLWSLRYEWIFYLFLLPTCSIVVGQASYRFSTLQLSVLLCFAAFAAQKMHFIISILFYMPLFTIGMVAYELQRREFIRVMMRSRSAAAVALLSLASSTIFDWVPYNIRVLLVGFFFTTIACGNRFGGLLDTTSVRTLGEYSFGIYLIHGIVLTLFFVELHALSRSIPNIALPFALPLITFVTVILSHIAHITIERPGIRCGRLFTAYLDKNSKWVSTL